MMKVDELLGNKNLSRTPCRVEILRLLMESASALSEQEIREKLSYDFDRTTIYRTLRSFLSQDVIHSISLEGKEVRYALNPGDNHRGSPYHVHFSCNQCKNVYCISHDAFTVPKVPEKFRPDTYDMLVYGLCDKCNI